MSNCYAPARAYFADFLSSAEVSKVKFEKMTLASVAAVAGMSCYDLAAATCESC